MLTTQQMKKLLISSGYPRSGNTYLNYCLHLLYFPNEVVNNNIHTVTGIEKLDKVIVPFRNPLDCISSWYTYPWESSIQEDIQYYIRFHKAVLDNLHKIVLIDFDFFTQDIDYIKDKVFKNFGIDTTNFVTDIQVKETMLANSKELNLPRNNKLELDVVKAELQQIPEFTECIDLYARLKRI